MFDHLMAKQKLNDIIEGFIQKSLEHWQAEYQPPLMQPVPVLDHPHGEEIFPGWCPGWILSGIAFCLFLICYHCLPGKRDQHLLLSISPPQKVVEDNKITSWFPFLQTGQPKCLQTLLMGSMPSSPLTSFSDLLWTLPSTLTKFWYCGAQNCAHCSRWGTINMK